MNRCLMKGEKGFEVFVGLCVLAHNMTKLAELLKIPKKKKTKKKATKQVAYENWDGQNWWSKIFKHRGDSVST